MKIDEIGMTGIRTYSASIEVFYTEDENGKPGRIDDDHEGDLQHGEDLCEELFIVEKEDDRDYRERRHTFSPGSCDSMINLAVFLREHDAKPDDVERICQFVSRASCNHTNLRADWFNHSKYDTTDKYPVCRLCRQKLLCLQMDDGQVEAYHKRKEV